jgi:hypothetical protein
VRGCFSSVNGCFNDVMQRQTRHKWFSPINVLFTDVDKASNIKAKAIDVNINEAFNAKVK